ncbi:MAG TPA: hypothetical protein VGF17_03125 [Phytomonospora sp.]
MAGESPGKSEQRKSSGETTTSERDPRIAVSHSPSPSGVPSGEDGVIDDSETYGTDMDGTAGDYYTADTGAESTEGTDSVLNPLDPNASI